MPPLPGTTSRPSLRSSQKTPRSRAIWSRASSIGRRVCRGRTEIRELALALSRRGRPWGGHEPPIIRGNTVVIEHRSASSDAEKFSVDIIEVKDGRIQSLRAYAGWRAILALSGGAEADAAPT